MNQGEITSIASTSLSPVAHAAILAMKRGEVHEQDFTIERLDGSRYQTRKPIDPQQVGKEAYKQIIENVKDA